MNQQPPCEPNHSDNGEIEAQQRIDELYRLTQEILVLSPDPHLPELGQLILRRAQLLTEIQKLNLDTLPKEQQAPLLEQLQVCKALDKTIEQNLHGFYNNLEQQIKSLKEAKNLLDKYKLPDEQQNMGTRSQDA